MSELLKLDEILNVIDQIARESGVNSYELDINEERFTGNDYSSRIVRVNIIDLTGEQNDIYLIVKLTNMSLEFREKMESSDFVYGSEIAAYTKFFPELSAYEKKHRIPEENCFIYPKYYKGDCTKLKEYVILKDLLFDGYEIHSRRKQLDFRHAKAVLEQLAFYNSISFAMLEKDAAEFNKILDNVPKEMDIPDVLYQEVISLTDDLLLQMVDEEKKKVIHDFVLNAHEAMSQCFLNSFTAPYNVIIHGDLNLKNILFKNEEDNVKAIFLDWQLFRLASPTFDIVRIIYTSTDKKFRDKHYSQLCDIYYRALQDNLKYYGCDISKTYPRDVFEKHLVAMLPFGIISGLIGGSIFLDKYCQCEGGHLSDCAENSVNDELLRRLDGLVDDIAKMKP